MPFAQVSACQPCNVAEQFVVLRFVRMLPRLCEIMQLPGFWFLQPSVNMILWFVSMFNASLHGAGHVDLVQPIQEQW